jgi:hypothetical protein
MAQQKIMAFMASLLMPYCCGAAFLAVFDFLRPAVQKSLIGWISVTFFGPT